jgi:hypothetical protein
MPAQTENFNVSCPFYGKMTQMLPEGGINHG